MGKLKRRGGGDLPRSTRPRKLSEIYGNDEVVNALRNLLVKDVPQRTIMFSGENGTGKTTLARIMACAISCDELEDIKDPARVGEPCLKCKSCRAILSNEPGMRIDGVSDGDIKQLAKTYTKGLKPKALKATEQSIREALKAETSYVYYREINGAEISKESAAEIARDLSSQFLYSNKPRIVVIDEAQEMSTAAMRYLLKPLEDIRSGVWVFICTSEPRKMPKALRQRFLQLETLPLNEGDISAMISDVAALVGLDLDTPASTLAKRFVSRGIRAPREIIKTVEAMSDGFSSVNVPDERGRNFFEVAKLLLSTRYSRSDKIKLLQPTLEEITPRDVVPIQMMITNYMKTVVTRNGSERANRILGTFLNIDTKVSVNPVAAIVHLIIASLDV